MQRHSEQPRLQALFDALLDLAEDEASEMYEGGHQRGGAPHRLAFWAGYNSAEAPDPFEKDTLRDACFAAGQEFRRRQDQLGVKPVSGAGERASGDASAAAPDRCAVTVAGGAEAGEEIHKRGRPRLDPSAVRGEVIRIRSTEFETAKYEMLGGHEWFRNTLKNA